MSWIERLATAGAVGYLIVMGWAMQRLEYDVWGALLTAPLIIIISAVLINRAFGAGLEALRPLAWAGLFTKLFGAVLGYFVRASAYGGAADANAYHDAGAALAASVRDGSASVLTLIPTDTGTRFVDNVTAIVYTIVGPSKLGGYFIFAWVSYWGLVFALKAGIAAVPALAQRRYAMLLFGLPSLIYWGSSIGKEALVGFALGVIAYGLAVVMSDRERRPFGITMMSLGTLIAAMVRPHFAAIWIGAAAIALGIRIVVAVGGRRSAAPGGGSRFGAVVMLGLAGIGFVIVSMLTLNYLDPTNADDDVAAPVTDRISTIFEETERRTSQGSSSFTPVVVDSPSSYPYAAFRTLTRPWIFEARSVAELLPALEMTALLVIGARSWRRFAELPRLMTTSPYLVFAVVSVFTFGVAFASIGNLGLLVRQRSLILPVMLVFWCLPSPQVDRANTLAVAVDAPGGHRSSVV